MEQPMKHIRQLAWRLRSEWKRWYYFEFFPSAIDKLIKLSTRKARRVLKKQETKRILVDTQIFYHSISHLTCKITTGKTMWGNTEINTFTTARVPVWYPRREFKSIQYLPAIVSLSNQKLIQFYSSWELRDEEWSQPTHRYRPLGIADYSLMQNIDIKLFDDKDYNFDFGSWIYGCRQTPKQQRQQRLSQKDDPLYLGLLSALGRKNSQDIWHIVTAEREGCYCLLTMDYKLIRALQAQRKNKFVQSLTTRIMTPEQLGEEWNLQPISHRYFSYHEARTPVRNDLWTERT